MRRQINNFIIIIILLYGPGGKMNADPDPQPWWKHLNLFAWQSKDLPGETSGEAAVGGGGGAPTHVFQALQYLKKVIFLLFYTTETVLN